MSGTGVSCRDADDQSRNPFPSSHRVGGASSNFFPTPNEEVTIYLPSGRNLKSFTWQILLFLNFPFYF